MAFKVIDGDGPGKEERDLQRQQEWALSEFSWALRDCAANMLRTIRGAGKPEQLLADLQKTIDAAVKYREAHGHWPASYTIAKELRLEDELSDLEERERAGTINRQFIDGWIKNGSFERASAEHTIYRGALQAIASNLIGQGTQKISGEREFYEGFRELERLREKNRREAVAASRALRKKPGTGKKRAKPEKPIEL